MQLTRHFSDQFYVSENDFTVEVLKLEPGPGISRTQTRAIVDVEFLVANLVQKSDLVYNMEQLIGGRLARSKVIDVTGIFLRCYTIGNLFVFLMSD